MENEKIYKTAHNLQFENSWTNWVLKTKMKGWYFDTQLSSHILDNRSGITGLKFQTYVNFGLSGYDEDVKPYIESKEKGSYQKNRMEEFMMEFPDKCLLYCGIDSHFTNLLQKKHIGLLDNHLKKGIDLFMESNIILSSLHGIRFNYELYIQTNKDLTKQINEIHETIMNSREVNKLENKENFNYNSDKDLRNLLFIICGWKSKNTTSSGVKSVNAETLLSFNKKLTNNIIKQRKLKKIRNTYLAQFERECVEIDGDYFIFPNFCLNIPKSYRSSSFSPNFQNIPVREKLAMRLVRSLLIPRKNRLILEIDFKSMEVGISCCYHNDPVMIDYVTNKGDMHKDISKQAFIRDEENYIENLPYSAKKERYWGKNGIVFPEFYGSTARIWSDIHKKQGYGDVTGNLWEMIENRTKEHLAEHGINNIFEFQKHMEKIEDHFWGTRFKVYQQWKFDNWKKYKEKGYINFKTGFRSTDIMGYNDSGNWPVQGTAYHVAQNVLNKTETHLQDNKFSSFMLGQIHDSGIFDVDPKELYSIIDVVKSKIKDVSNEWTWLNIPLSVEAEVTEINGSWADKKEIEI